MITATSICKQIACQQQQQRLQEGTLRSADHTGRMTSKRGQRWQSPHSRLQKRHFPEALIGRYGTMLLACMSPLRHSSSSRSSGAPRPRCMGRYDGRLHVAQVHKFGGTCVAAAERISEVAQLIAEDEAEQKLVVVSAMGSHPSSPVKVTDLLLNMVAKASKQDQAFLIDLAALQVGEGACWGGLRLLCFRPCGGRLLLLC